MRRILVAAAALTMLLTAGTALAQAPETYTPQQAFASPTVTVGGKTATRLCDLGSGDTKPDQPGVIEEPAPPRPPCSQQSVPPLRLHRARYARITLQAPADRVLAGWYQGGGLRPLRLVQSGAQQWNVTLPPTSGRLFLGLIFEINVTATPYDLRTDWKLSVRRKATPKPAPTGPTATEPVPIDDPTPLPPVAREPAPPATFTDSGR